MNEHLRNRSIQQDHELASAYRGVIQSLRADPISKPGLEFLLVG